MIDTYTAFLKCYLFSFVTSKKCYKKQKLLVMLAHRAQAKMLPFA